MIRSCPHHHVIRCNFPLKIKDMSFKPLLLLINWSRYLSLLPIARPRLDPLTPTLIDSEEHSSSIHRQKHQRHHSSSIFVRVELSKSQKIQSRPCTNYPLGRYHVPPCKPCAVPWRVYDSIFDRHANAASYEQHQMLGWCAQWQWLLSDQYQIFFEAGCRQSLRHFWQR